MHVLKFCRHPGATELYSFKFDTKFFGDKPMTYSQLLRKYGSDPTGTRDEPFPPKDFWGFKAARLQKQSPMLFSFLKPFRPSTEDFKERLEARRLGLERLFQAHLENLLAHYGNRRFPIHQKGFDTPYLYKQIQEEFPDKNIGKVIVKNAHGKEVELDFTAMGASNTQKAYIGAVAIRTLKCADPDNPKYDDLRTWKKMVDAHWQKILNEQLSFVRNKLGRPIWRDDVTL